MDVSCGLEPVPVWCDQNVVESLPKQFRYVRGSIPGPGLDAELFEERIAGCDCVDTCENSSSCTCMRYGLNYQNSKLIQTENPVFECNSSCSCSSSCSNRLVQFGLKNRIQIFLTKNQGLGAKTLDKIEKGSFVFEYAGEVVDHSEASKRTRNQEGMNYLISCLEHARSGTVETYVDPKYFGNVGRFVNHGCEPSLVMVPVRVETMVPRLALFAGRDILEEEELTFDYGGGAGDSRDDRGGSDNTRRSGIPKGDNAETSGLVDNISSDQSEMSDVSSRKPCFCGAEKCRRFLPFDPHLV